MKYIVLVSEGKREVTDHVTVKLFDTKTSAETYCQTINTNSDNQGKYWKYAGIIENGESVETGNPYIYKELEY